FAKEESNLFRNIFLNPNTEENIIEQFREVSQQEIIKDSRFDNISEERRTELFFDCWTYAQGLASFIALGQIEATEAELIDILLRGPGYLVHKKLEEYGVK
ncbi:transcriptional regulator, partial [Fusobacterium necrophorum DJ-1]